MKDRCDDCGSGRILKDYRVDDDNSQLKFIAVKLCRSPDRHHGSSLCLCQKVETRWRK